MKHTPGPWMHGNSDKPVSLMAVCFGAGTAGGTVVRFAESGDISFDETMANARLIAAAPDLLAALLELSQHFTGEWVNDPRSQSEIDDHYVEAQAIARAAIAKATGSAA